jgi:hypothetical protein
MKLFDFYKKLLFEQNYRNQKVKSIISAMNNRNPITFYYTGPDKPPRDKVLKGVRIRAEVVAYGLSKKGNEIIRAYVEPPSTSLKGFDKTNWRTFRIDRMSSIRILTDETYDKRNDGQYKEGDESIMGPMVKTFFTIKWDKTPEISEPKKPIRPPKVKEPIPPTKPEPVTTEPSEPEQPISKTPPPLIPTNDFVKDIFKKLETNIKDTEKGKMLSSQDFETYSRELYKLKEKEWVDLQKSLGKNTKPGEGTRKRFEIDSKNELAKELQKNNIKVGLLPINESINRIKTLMFY